MIELNQFELKAMQWLAYLAGIKKLRRLGHNYEFEQIKNYVQGDDVRRVIVGELPPLWPEGRAAVTISSEVPPGDPTPILPASTPDPAPQAVVARARSSRRVLFRASPSSC